MNSLATNKSVDKFQQNCRQQRFYFRSWAHKSADNLVKFIVSVIGILKTSGKNENDSLTATMVYTIALDVCTNVSSTFASVKFKEFFTVGTFLNFFVATTVNNSTCPLLELNGLEIAGPS